MNHDAPQVTTILTTFRRPVLLRRAILSALAQEYRNITVLVLDDASNDGTGELVHSIAALDSRVKYVCHSQNVGMTANWRYGLEQVRTPYFSFLSDDDLHLPGFYAFAVDKLEGNREFGFCCGSTIGFSERGEVRGVSTEGWTEGEHKPYLGMLGMMQKPISWNGVVFRRSVFEAIGTLREIHATDYEYLVRAARRFPFFVGHVPCAMFLYHSGRQAWKQADRQHELFLQTFALAGDFLASDDIPLEVRSEAWPVVNAEVISAGKYLLLNHIINGRFREARDVADYLRRVCPQSAVSCKYSILAAIAHRMPLVASMLRRRLLNPPPIRGGRQRRWQKQYGKWVRYASDHWDVGAITTVRA